MEELGLRIRVQWRLASLSCREKEQWWFNEYVLFSEVGFCRSLSCNDEALLSGLGVTEILSRLLSSWQSSGCKGALVCSRVFFVFFQGGLTTVLEELRESTCIYFPKICRFGAKKKKMIIIWWLLGDAVMDGRSGGTFFLSFVPPAQVNCANQKRQRNTRIFRYTYMRKSVWMIHSSHFNR